MTNVCLLQHFDIKTKCNNIKGEEEEEENNDTNNEDEKKRKRIRRRK